MKRRNTIAKYVEIAGESKLTTATGNMWATERYRVRDVGEAFYAHERLTPNPRAGNKTMKPIEFKEQTVVYAKDQPPYLPLPVHRTEDGHCTSCWSLSFRERIKLLFTGRIWWSQLTFNTPLQPIRPSTDYPFTEP